MAPHGRQVVQADVRGDLEFQGHPGFPHLLQQLLSLRAAQVAGIQPVAEPHVRHRLAGRQRFLHAADAVGHIVPQAVILARVDPQHKPRVFPGNFHQFPNGGAQLEDIVDLLADDIAAGHIRIHGHCPQHAQVFRQVVRRGDPAFHNGEGNPPDAGQEADQHARFPGNRGHDLMDFPQAGRRVRRVHQRRIGYLRIQDALALVLPRNPQQQVLEQRVPRIALILPVPAHPQHVFPGDPVRNVVRVQAAEGILRGDSLGKHIPVQVNLLQVGKYRLPVLRDGEGIPDAADVLRRVRGVSEDQVGEVDEYLVVNLAVPVLSVREAVLHGRLRPRAASGQELRLRRGDLQLQLLDIVQRIAQLVDDAQGNQRVRRQVAVHMGMQVGMEFALRADIRLDDRLLLPGAVVLGLAHQGFGDCGNGGLHLHPAVRVDVGHLGIAQAEDVHPPVFPVKVAGDLPADHQQSLLPGLCLQPAQPGQVGDQVARMVVRGADHMEQPVPLHIEVHHNILLPVQEKLLEPDHAFRLLP